MTSHDAVAFVRRVLKEKRVGHTGTLDPAAAGVLPICVGVATRLAEYLQAGEKEYLTEAVFGAETDSGDLLGDTVATGEIRHLNLEVLQAASAKFLGEIEQTPPMHSAIKVDGKKLYEIAREGGEVEIPVRQVTIREFELYGWESGHVPSVKGRVVCSGGTYIRSLVRDLGQAAGSRATMSFLVRSRSGRFRLEDAVTVEEFAANPTLMSVEDAALSSFETVLEDAGMVAEMSLGRKVPWEPQVSPIGENPILVLDREKATYVLASYAGGWLAPSKVLRAD